MNEKNEKEETQQAEQEENNKEQEEQKNEKKDAQKEAEKLEEMTVEEILEEKVSELEDELETEKEARKQYFKKLQRLQADFVNYRKRMEKEKDQIDFKAREDIILNLLPVIDNFERALESDSDESSLREGVEMIYKQLKNVLKQEGVETISSEGEEFDHNYHEAMMQIEDSEHESGTVVEEIEKGYILDEQVIRPAKVKVVK